MSATRRERDRAACLVLELLGKWARPHFLRIFRGRFQKLASDEQNELVQHALQEVVLAASRGGFSATTERGAHSWCKRLITHRLQDALRRRSVRASTEPGGDLHDEVSLVAGDPFESEPEIHSDRGLSVFKNLVDLLESEIRNRHRPRDVPSVLRAFRCYVAHRLGETTAVQIEGSCDASSSADPAQTPHRARNRIYQRRRRGRLAAEAALRDALRQRRWGEDLMRAAQAIGICSRAIES